MERVTFLHFGNVLYKRQCWVDVFAPCQQSPVNVANKTLSITIQPQLLEFPRSNLRIIPHAADEVDGCRAWQVLRHPVWRPGCLRTAPAGPHNLGNRDVDGALYVGQPKVFLFAYINEEVWLLLSISIVLRHDARVVCRRYALRGRQEADRRGNTAELDVVERALHLLEREGIRAAGAREAVVSLAADAHRAEERVCHAAEEQHGRLFWGCLCVFVCDGVFCRGLLQSTSDNQLDGFESLQHAHGADDGADDAAFAAADDALWRRGLGEDASVARAAAGRAVEEEELARGLKRRGGDERFLEEHACVGDEVARRRVVGAVEDEVILRDDGGCVLGGEVCLVGFVCDARVQSDMSVNFLRKSKKSNKGNK